jgi:hypothetical protein
MIWMCNTASQQSFLDQYRQTLSSRSTLASYVRNCTGANRLQSLSKIRRDTSCSRTRGECRTEYDFLCRSEIAERRILSWFDIPVKTFSSLTALASATFATNESRAANKGSVGELSKHGCRGGCQSVFCEEHECFFGWTAERRGIS